MYCSALYFTELHCTDIATLHGTSLHRVQVKVHITVPHVTEAPFSVGSVWSGQPTLGIDRRGALLYHLRSPYSTLPVLLALYYCPRSTLLSRCFAFPALLYSLSLLLSSLFSPRHALHCMVCSTLLSLFCPPNAAIHVLLFPYVLS